MGGLRRRNGLPTPARGGLKNRQVHAQGLHRFVERADWRAEAVNSVKKGPGLPDEKSIPLKGGGGFIVPLLARFGEPAPAVSMVFKPRGAAPADDCQG